MSKLRDSAALLVEAGKMLGHYEQARATERVLTRLLASAQPEPEPSAEAFAAHCRLLLTERDRIRDELPGYERVAQAARDRAAELVAEAEHPGAVLARRLLATVHGARAAWLGSR